MSGFSGPGGGVVGPGGGGGGGAVGFNDLNPHGRVLDWQRQWSWNLFDNYDPYPTLNPKEGPAAWCGRKNALIKGVTLGDLKATDMNKTFEANTRFNEDGKLDPNGAYSWQFVGIDGSKEDDSVAAWAATATCRSPMAVSSFGGKNNHYRNRNGNKDDDKNSEELRAYRYLADEDDKDSVYRQVGYTNKWHVSGSNLANNPNASGRDCYPKEYGGLTGGCSWSEQIPIHPDNTGAVQEAGSATAAIVRVWRECAHKYPSYDNIELGGRLDPVKGDGQGLYVNGKESCNTEPILERVMPKMADGQDDCPSPRKGYHGNWNQSLLGHCSNTHNIFYAQQLHGFGYAASERKSRGAFGANGDDPEGLAGPLFGACRYPAGSQRGLDYRQKRYCKTPVDEYGEPTNNPIGKWDHESLGENQVFQRRCRRGVVGKPDDWQWTDYAGQLAQALTSDDKEESASASRRKRPNGAPMVFSFASSKKKSPASYDKPYEPDPKKNAFVDLFGWWNPTFYHRLTTPRDLRPLGIPGLNTWPGVEKSEVENKMHIFKGSNDGNDFPRGQWPPQSAIKEGMMSSEDNPKKREKISPSEVKDVTCLGLNEWIALDWVLGVPDRKGTDEEAGVFVYLQPIPNRLYAVQIVLIDQRENIIGQSLQFMGGPAKGQLPTIRPDIKPDTCTSPIDGKTYPAGDKECSPPWCWPEASIKERDFRKELKRYWRPWNGETKPEACSWDQGEPDYGLPPLASVMQSRQPKTQVLGQAWSVPDNSSLFLGRLGANVSDLPGSPLPDTPTKDEEGEPIDFEKGWGLWTPRALKVSIFNPEIWSCAERGRDEYKAECLKDKAIGQKVVYDKRHRIVAQSDQGTGLVTDKRFEMSGQYLLSDTPGGPGWISGDRWFQASLPLMYADTGTDLFYNSWAVGVNSPTRAPKEDDDIPQIARDLASKYYGKNYDSLPAGEQVTLRDAAATWRRAQVDESRFATLMGEGRFLYKTATKQTCTSVPGSDAIKCGDMASAVENNWHRLTSDKCPSGAYRGKGSRTVSWADNPWVSVNGSKRDACDPEKSLGDGWKVSDAYKLPELPGSDTVTRTAELSSSFRVDGNSPAPAHLELDSDIPEGKLLGVDIWRKADYAARGTQDKNADAAEEGAKSVAPIYTTDVKQKYIHFCTPIEPYYVDKLVTLKSLRLPYESAQPARQLTHFSSAWAGNVLQNMLEFGKEPSEERKDYQADPGGQVNDQGYDTAGKQGKWYVLKSTPPFSRSTQRMFGLNNMDDRGENWYKDSNKPDISPYTPMGRAMYILLVEQSEERGWKVQRMPDGRVAVWVEDKQYQVPNQPGLRQFHPMWALRQAALDNWWRRPGQSGHYGVDTYWSGYRTEWNDWEEIGSGNPWWWNNGESDNGWDNLDTDLGSRTTFRKVEEPDRKVVRQFLGEDVGECTDLDAARPNAQVLQDPDGVDNDNNGKVDDEVLRDDSTGKPLLAPRLDPGDYVVSFRVAGPIAPPAGKKFLEWGIQGMYPEAKNNEWVNSFDLQQQSGTTAIYRLRPTG